MTKTHTHVNIRDLLAFLSTFYNTETQYVESKELTEFLSKTYSEKHAFNKIRELIKNGFLERTQMRGVYRVLKIK